jgi:photosystem II CP47 chlorophyll apoprotein
MNKIRLPWFRVHIVMLNDPGRLISVHIIHTGLVAGWSGVMALYELITFDPTDPVYNPSWRQGCYVIPFISRIGVISSLYSWSLGIKLRLHVLWTYETVNACHISLSGLLILASFWHWAYWDLNVFAHLLPGKCLLDLNKIIGIHLFLSSLVCFGFGYGHLSGFLGPGIWTEDSIGVLGSIRFVKPIYSLTFTMLTSPFCLYGLLSSHHCSAGFSSLLIGFWHIESRPGPLLYKVNKMGNVESVLSTSISIVFFTGFVNSALIWYAGVSSPIELFGPNRYHWDNGYFSQDIEGRVKSVSSIFLNKAWEQVPEKLTLYDYIGSNPSKGGLFRSGPILKGDGIVQNWLGHLLFEMGTSSLAVRRSVAFFETFPAQLIDASGTLRADIPFRRAESLNSIEQRGVVLYFEGGILGGTEYSIPSLVKDYARKAQFGEIFTFDFKTSGADGVFRTSPRGWYSFSHTAFALLFWFGHLFHAERAVFQDLQTGLTIESLYQVELCTYEELLVNASFL